MKSLIIALSLISLNAMASIGEDINNSWGDTLSEGDVEYISSKNSVERLIGCRLMIQAPARGYDNEQLLAWELYDICKNESIAMGLRSL
jgi:hypothetical protein